MSYDSERSVHGQVAAIRKKMVTLYNSILKKLRNSRLHFKIQVKIYFFFFLQRHIPKAFVGNIFGMQHR